MPAVRPSANMTMHPDGAFEAGGHLLGLAVACCLRVAVLGWQYRAGTENLDVFKVGTSEALAIALLTTRLLACQT